MNQASPTDEEFVRLCRTIRNRVLRLPERRGLLDSDPSGGTDDQPALFEAIAAASIAGRVALGERAGKALTRLGARAGHEIAFGCNASADRRHTWAELMQRVFTVDVLCCADCGDAA